MIYIERQPAAPLAGIVRSLWYARASQPVRGRQRVLPTGCAQAILTLARDFLLDCPDGDREHPVSPALIVGPRSIFEIIDLTDLADLIGIVFEPGGLSAFAADSADLFSNRSVALDGVWGASANSLRSRLRENPGPHQRLECLEKYLLERLAARPLRDGQLRHRVVAFAVNRFQHAPGISTVREVARSTGWSERRFSQVFREEVGFSPKVWCRIQRFQRTVRQLHAGAPIPWAEMALNLGFYDQSHFANEFKAFSGIDATTYSALASTPWANHVRAD